MRSLAFLPSLVGGPADVPGSLQAILARRV
jgi:hypothetical protein